MAQHICHECERPIARNAQEAAKGYCPKYWAIRDKAAQEDCERVADSLRWEEPYFFDHDGKG